MNDVFDYGEFLQYFQSFSCGEFFFTTLSTNSIPYLLQLPTSLLVEISTFLEIEDIINFAKTSNATSLIIKEKRLWDEQNLLMYGKNGGKELFIQNFIPKTKFQVLDVKDYEKPISIFDIFKTKEPLSKDSYIILTTATQDSYKFMAEVNLSISSHLYEKEAKGNGNGIYFSFIESSLSMIERSSVTDGIFIIMNDLSLDGLKKLIEMIDDKVKEKIPLLIGVTIDMNLSLDYIGKYLFDYKRLKHLRKIGIFQLNIDSKQIEKRNIDFVCEYFTLNKVFS